MNLYPNLRHSVFVAVAMFVSFCAYLTCRVENDCIGQGSHLFICSSQYNMELEKREELQQLIQKSKNEHSEYDMYFLQL